MYFFPLERELSVFGGRLCKETAYLLHVIKLELYQVGNICLWLPRKPHLLFKITNDMKDEITKQYMQAALPGSFRKISLDIYLFFFF